MPPARFQLPADREHRWLRRLLGATPWIVGCMALFAFYLRISFTGHVSSDGANSALQAMAPGARTHVRPRGYWNSSAITLESGDRVRVRAVLMDGRQVIPYLWETNTLWFDASRYYANFVIIDLADPGLSPFAEQTFGKPVRIGHLAQWEILIYQKNLLKQLAMPGTGP